MTLLEKGLILPEAIQMSGPTTPAMLKRYTRLPVDPIAAKLAAQAGRVPERQLSRLRASASMF